MSDRYDSLQPASLIASMASMPRRWNDGLRVSPPKNIDEYFTVAGDRGTAAEHAGAAIAQLSILRDAIRTTSYNLPESLPTEVVSAAANAASGPWPESAGDALAELTEIFETLEKQLKQLNPRDWNKSADAGSAMMTVLALAQGASRVAADRLAIVEETIRTASH